MAGDISTKPRSKGNSRDEQDRLVILASDFGKLEESRKDHIRELTRKLAGIHCEAESGGAVFREAALPFQI